MRAEKFKFCLVGKFTRSRPSQEQIKDWAANEWKLEGSCSITLLDQSHVLIRLESEADMMRVWPRSQWFVEGHMMRVFKWTPTFRPLDREPSSAAVWISLPCLPVVFYDEDLLYPIASLVGKVLGMDDHTRNLTRTTFARVCVEVDLLKEPPCKVHIRVGKEGFWQRIDYEEWPSYCANCCMIGHTTEACSRNKSNVIVDTSEEKVPSCSFTKFKSYQTYPLVKRCMLVHSVRTSVGKDLKNRVANMGKQRHPTEGVYTNNVGKTQEVIAWNLRQNSIGEKNGMILSKQFRSGIWMGKVKFHTTVNQRNEYYTEEQLQMVEERTEQEGAKQQEEEDDDDKNDEHDDDKTDDQDNDDKDDDDDHDAGNRKGQSKQHKKHSEGNNSHDGGNTTRSHFRVSNVISFWKKRVKKRLEADMAELSTKTSFALQTNETGKLPSLTRFKSLVTKPVRPFSFTEIKRATKNFKGACLVGEGGFGPVYKGMLHGGAAVAVKRLMPDSFQGSNEFKTEIEFLSRLRFKNLVPLIGYCTENDENILVYEFMPRGDLGKHLFASTDRHLLSWTKRLRICIGAARGLHYLHTNGVIHRDVKTTNILIDENWEAKLTDLGISKLAATNGRTHVSTRVMGTSGYLCPVYLTTGHLSYQTDVYAFGVVLFEVLFGKRVLDGGHLNLDTWRQSCRRNMILQAKIDSCLKDEVSPKCLKKFSALATKCLSVKLSDRPGMGDVLCNLEFILQLQQHHAAGRPALVDSASL